MTLRYSGGSAATVGTPRATVELRARLPDRPGGGDGDARATTGNNAFVDTAVPVTHPAGTHRLYLVFGAVTGGPTTGLVNLNWVEFG